MLPFSTHSCYFHITLPMLGDEMKGHLVGPMPAKKFLNKFLPKDKLPRYSNIKFPSDAQPGQREVSIFMVAMAAVGVTNYHPIVLLNTNTLILLLLGGRSHSGHSARSSIGFWWSTIGLPLQEACCHLTQSPPLEADCLPSDNA